MRELSQAPPYHSAGTNGESITWIQRTSEIYSTWRENPPYQDANPPLEENTVSHSLNRDSAKATYAFQHLSFDCMSSRRRASKESPWLGQVDYPRNVHSPDERGWMVRGQVLELYDAEVAHVGFFNEPPRVGESYFELSS